MKLDDDIAKIAEQERLLVFKQFDAAVAWELGSMLKDVAQQRSLPVAIDISLIAMPMFYVAMPGATPDNVRWIRRKRNVVFHFLKSSYAIGRKLARDEATLEAKFSLADVDYAPHGGSFPITVDGAGLIGAVTVSGLPQREDHNVVVAALAAMLGQDATCPMLGN